MGPTVRGEESGLPATPDLLTPKSRQLGWWLIPFCQGGWSPLSVCEHALRRGQGPNGARRGHLHIVGGAATTEPLRKPRGASGHNERAHRATCLPGWPAVERVRRACRRAGARRPGRERHGQLRRLLDPNTSTLLERVNLVVQWEVARKRTASPPTTLLGTTWAP